MVMMAIERIGATLAAQTGMVGPLSTIADGRGAARRAVHGWMAAGTVLVLAGVWLLAKRAEGCERGVTHGSGIAGKWALVCAASKGLGKGCAQALVREGVNVVITARGAEALEATAAELRALNPRGEVRAVAGDITTPEGRAAALAACPQVDILVNNAGGPPPGDFRDWDRDAWIKALDANMLTPIELIKATVDAMAERGFGRIVNITSGAVKAPIDILGLSNGARSGLTGFVAGLARQTAGRAT